jgi:hypothetical protein
LEGVVPGKCADTEESVRCDCRAYWFHLENPLSCLQAASVTRVIQANHPYAAVLARQRQQAFVHQLVRVLSTMQVPTARDGLKRASELSCSVTRNLIDGSIPRHSDESTPHTDWILERVHKDLVLAGSCKAGSVSLAVETPQGFRDELVMSDFASKAILFLERRHAFDIRELPGDFSEEERTTIGLAVEGTGLFRRVWRNDNPR